MPGVWACLYLIGLPVGIGWLSRADAPFPIFIGEVLSVFGFVRPRLLVLFLVCGALPFWK